MNSKIIAIIAITVLVSSIGSITVADAIVSTCAISPLPQPTNIWTAICDLQSQVNVLRNSINVERVTRQNADTNISNSLTTEINNRISADSLLASRITDDENTNSDQQNQIESLRCNNIGPSADLHGCDLNQINLFNNVNLSHADLSDTNLSNARIESSYLFRADLTGANLSGARLNFSDLTEANLSGTNLDGTDFEGTQITSATFVGCTGTPIGTPAGGTPLPTCS